MSRIGMIGCAIAALGICAGSSLAQQVNDKPFEEGWWPSKWGADDSAGSANHTRNPANVKRALRGARSLRAGTVTVNAFGEGDISTPFGGFKQSGFGGRDNGIHAHDQYTQVKTIWVDLADDADEAVT